jgi:anti-sigma factor RsiW
MNDCPRGDIRDLLPDLVHEQLDSGMRTQVRSHIERCADCAAEVQLLRTARSALRRPVPVNVERVASAVPVAPRRLQRARTPAWVLPIAATLLMILTGGLVIAFLGDGGAGGTIATGIPVDTPRLADGVTDPVPVMPAPGGAPGGTMPGRTPELVLASEAGLFVGGLADLDDDELESMLQLLDTLDPLPDEEPVQLIQGLGVTEG